MGLEGGESAEADVEDGSGGFRVEPREGRVVGLRSEWKVFVKRPEWENWDWGEEMMAFEK